MEARADRESRPRDKNGVLMPMLLGHLKPLTEAELAVLGRSWQAVGGCRECGAAAAAERDDIRNNPRNGARLR